MRMLKKLTISLFVLAVALGASRVVYWNSKIQTADDAFTEKVQKVIPAFLPTEEILGLPVIYSPGFAVTNVEGVSIENTRRQIFQKWLSGFEKVGLPEVFVVFRVSNSDSDRFFGAHVPGCEPNTCSDLFFETEIVGISKETWEIYSPDASQIKSLTKKIVAYEIGGINYEAWLFVRFDSLGRINRVRVSYSRPPQSFFERLRAAISNGNGAEKYWRILYSSIPPIDRSLLN